MLELTHEQHEAATEILVWYQQAKGYGGSLTLGGYAGTGKTTLLGQIKDILPRGTRIVFTSFTGKAVSVMRSKLPPGSELSTLHRLLYRPRQKAFCITSGEDVIFIGGQCEPHEGRTYQKEPGHKFNERRPCEVRKALDWSQIADPLEDYDLVIVDEASMVSEKLWADLSKWGVPVLAVGDHGQLPPVRSEFNLMDNPQLRLEKILRQAEKSPIIRMATLARTTGHIPIADYGPGCIKMAPFKRTGAMLKLHPEKGDLALCSFNATRNSTNTVLRKRVVNPPSGDPVEGDIVICLRNSYEAGVFNGMRGRISDLGPVSDYGLQRFAEVDLLDEDYRFEGEISTEQFGKPKTLNDVPRRLGLWDYGYCMTVHKSQGSQADRVLVIEERFPRDGDEFHARLLYTAVTRAVRSLCIVGPA